MGLMLWGACAAVKRTHAGQRVSTRQRLAHREFRGSAPHVQPGRLSRPGGTARGVQRSRDPRCRAAERLVWTIAHLGRHCGRVDAALERLCLPVDCAGDRRPIIRQSHRSCRRHRRGDLARRLLTLRLVNAVSPPKRTDRPRRQWNALSKGEGAERVPSGDTSEPARGEATPGSPNEPPCTTRKVFEKPERS
jgi:hypothetical protein